MNTPAHLAASLLAWRNEPGWRGALAVSFGAVLPDLPMFGFFAFQKFIGTDEYEIWDTLYFQPHWQTFFDIFNSIPLALLVALVCVYLRQPLLIMMACSAILHMLCDLPVHHDDGHRHFWPIDWRFASPVSYWDPKHYGAIVAPIELLFAVIASGWLSFSAPHKPMRVIARINLGFYVLVGLMILGFFMRKWMFA